MGVSFPFYFASVDLQNICFTRICFLKGKIDWTPPTPVREGDTKQTHKKKRNMAGAFTLSCVVRLTVTEPSAAVEQDWAENHTSSGSPGSLPHALILTGNRSGTHTHTPVGQVIQGISQSRDCRSAHIFLGFDGDGGGASFVCSIHKKEKVSTLWQLGYITACMWGGRTITGTRKSVQAGTHPNS